MDTEERRRLLSAILESLDAGLWRAALALCRRLPPDDAEGRLLLGLALGGLGEVDAAAWCFDAVARAHPDHAHPCTDFARLYPDGPVASLFEACLTLAPNDARLRQAFGAWLADRGRPTDAERVVQGTAGNAAGAHAMGLALAEQGYFGEAEGFFRDATRLDPRLAIAWANLGMVLRIEGRYDEAMAAYDQAIRQSPRDAAIRLNRVMALLHAGRWAEAWREPDWRLRLPGYRGLGEDRLLPPDVDLRDRTVLLTHADGFGDTLQFLRYVPLLAERGARVLARMPPPLTRLVRLVPGVAAVVPDEGPVPLFDYHCPMVSLPRVFGTTPEAIPPGAYLRVPATRNAIPRIGLVWAGQAGPWRPGFAGLDARHGIEPSALAPLSTLSGVTFVSLQTGDAARSPPLLPGLENPMEEVRDFADTAAIVSELDLVLSVDTAIVHLAGAMGKPVFMLDRYDHCWRWLGGRTDTPWYPEMRIFRQERPNDWRRVVERVVAAIREGLATPDHPSRAPQCQGVA